MDVAASFPSRPGRDPADLRGEFERSLLEIERAAREAGVDPNDFDGRLVKALVAGIALLGRLAEVHEARITAETVEERKRLGDMHSIGQQTLAQMRNGIIGFEIQREMAVAHFMEKTAPVFASELGKVLAIREKRWNLNLRMMWLAGALAALVAAFAGGAGAVWWQSRDAVAGLRECLARPYVAGNQVWCRLPDWALGGVAGAAGATGVGRQDSR